MDPTEYFAILKACHPSINKFCVFYSKTAKYSVGMSKLIVQIFGCKVNSLRFCTTQPDRTIPNLLTLNQQIVCSSETSIDGFNVRK